MKVIKEGKLPDVKKRTLRGTCTNCGCVVEEDYEWLVNMTIPTVMCPTSGCNKPIYMLHKPIYMLHKHPENFN